MRLTLFIILLISVFACTEEMSERKTIATDSTKMDTPQYEEKTTNRPLETENTANTTTDINFQEFSISINRLLVYDPENKLDKTQGDTVSVYVELGETIEKQIITIISDSLTDIKIEQRFETSVTIMHEGPHCDLTDWKHHYSVWKEIRKIDTCKFIADEYDEKMTEKFPVIEIEALKEAVRKQCGDDWAEHIKNIQSPTEYPSGVSISRHFLRITGRNKHTGQLITKLIVLETPMGC